MILSKIYDVSKGPKYVSVTCNNSKQLSFHSLHKSKHSKNKCPGCWNKKSFDISFKRLEDSKCLYNANTDIAIDSTYTLICLLNSLNGI